MRGKKCLLKQKKLKRFKFVSKEKVQNATASIGGDFIRALNPMSYEHFSDLARSLLQREKMKFHISKKREEDGVS